MIIQDYDRGLKLFIADKRLPTSGYNYSNKDYAFVSQNQYKAILIPSQFNGIRNGLKFYPSTFASASIYDDVITYGRNYNAKNKLFTNFRISETEILGYFLGCGFILASCARNGKNKYYHFKRREVHRISLEKISVFVKLERIGKNGKEINIFKLRTMYPYAKHLQNDLINKFGSNENGKARNNFRITRIGKFMRRFHLDEFPQLINLFKGDIKLVGCRPVCTIFFKNYPNEVYTLRLQYKLGMISHVIAEVEDFIESEYRYLLKVSNAPITTKLEVCWKAFSNVLSGKIKSQ